MSGPTDRIGRYRLVAKIRETAAGTVYRAYDPELHRDVALTRLAHGRPDAAQALAQLQHPNVIAVYDVGEHDGDAYVATELVEGTSLAAWLKQGTRSWREIRDAFQQAGSGLVAAHAAGLVHGDFAIDDVIVGNDGRIRIGGFRPVDSDFTPQSDQRSFAEALDASLEKVPARLRKVLTRARSADPYPSMAALLDELARDPELARRRVLMWGGALAIAGAVTVSVALFARSTHAPSCASARPLLNDAWDAQQRARLSATFGHLDQPWAKAVHATVEGILDRYTTRWVDMHRESCEATRVRHNQSSLVLDLRSECLARHLDELRETVGMLATGDAATLENGVQIVGGLPALDDCADVAALTAPVPPPSTPEARVAVELLRKQLARGRALADAARFAAASRIARIVADRAQSLHYRPLEAEALLDLSNALEREGNYRDAEAVAQDASYAAEAGRHDHVAAEALIALVWLSGVRGHKYERAHDFAVQAAAAIERLDKRTALESELARCLGATYANEGRLDDALAQESRYLSLVESTDGPMAPTAGGVLVEVGEIYREQGRYDEALARYQRALKIFESTWGAAHPTVAVPLNNMGLVSRRLGRDEEALDYHRRALAIFERALGANHPHVAEARTNIGVVLLAQGKPEKAYEQFRLALAIDTNVSGAESAEAAIDLINMADARRDAHQLEEAAREGRRALAIAKVSLGEEDPILAEAYLSLGRTLAASRAHAEAIAAFKHALAIWQRPDAELEAGAGEAFTEMAAAELALGNRKDACASAETAIGLLEQASRDPSVLPRARGLLADCRKRLANE